MNADRRGLASSAQAFARILRLAVEAKLSYRLRGKSRVSASCQIPDIRKKYRELGLPKIGTFVEIGGFDGESFSNTSFLADEGWRGVYVEPLPRLCRQIRLRHLLNEVTVYQAAVSNKDGAAFFEDMDELSTLSSRTKSAYEQIEWAQSFAAGSRRVEIPTTTIERIFSACNLPNDFELLVIDVEGHEEPIVSDLLQSPWKPIVLVVELCDVHPDFVPFPELQASARRSREMIEVAGYKTYYVDAINSIFTWASVRS